MNNLAPSRRPHRAARFGVLLLPFGFALLIATGSLRAQSTSVRVETFSLKPNGQVKVENFLGATRVIAWDAQSVRVVAEKKAPAAIPLSPSELVLMGAQNTVVVQCRQASAATRIDLMVYVPRGSHLQVNGGAWPIDVTGSLASAIVETTGGHIEYQLPSADNARVVMHSARGAVRSTVPLQVSERIGTRSLQGRLGNGGSPVFLSSQTGNITLSPAPSSPSLAMSGTPSSIDAAEPSQTSSTDGATNQQRPGISRQPTAGPDQGDSSGDSFPPSNRTGRSSNQNAQPSTAGSSGWADIAGTKQSDDSKVEHRSGPLLRPRQETNTNSGGTGFRVRIIPSTQALGGARTQDSAVFDEAADETDPKRGSQGGVFDQPRRAPAPPQSSRPVDEEPYEVTPARPSGAPPVLRRSGEPEPAEPAAPSSYGATSAPAGEEAIRLNASLVNLNVMVTDRAGKALPGLKKEDFQVSENGESQSIEFFAPSSAPFNLVLLLDLSGSIQDKLDVVKSAALRFLDTVGPQDRVAVVTFSQRVRVVSQLTNNHDLVRERIKTIDRPVGGTAFYEAMWFALADTLRGTEGQRNAIVAMTDGVDSSLDRYDPAPTRVTFNRLHGRLEESDVIVFPIYLDTEYEEVFERGNGTSEAYAIARSQLEKIAEATGGQIFHAEQVKDLAGVYKQVAAALRTVYSVGYYSTKPERDGTYRRVHVGVSRGGAAVRTRRGYYAK